MLFWKLGLVVFSYQFVGTLTTGIGKHRFLLSSMIFKNIIYICVYMSIYILFRSNHRFSKKKPRQGFSVVQLYGKLSF